ncbi:MAG: DUF4271 domain-containing protein [Culturomica sp.]|jgi:hypothetical protein|nr:DUF4271 domain-containing protein [Culturomica sp.]
MPDTFQQNSSPVFLGDTICSDPAAQIVTATTVQPASFRYPVSERNKNEHTAPCLLYSVLFLSVFAFLRIRGKDLIPGMFHLLVNRKKFEYLQNEGISANITTYLSALILSFSAIAIAMGYGIHHTFLTEQTLYIFGFLFLYHFTVLCLTHLIAWIFNMPHTGEEVIVNVWCFHILTGLVISPFLIALFFVEAYAVHTLLIIIFSCLGILLLIEFFRWIQILFAHRISIFYMILYLCTFEMIPLLVLYKLLVCD